MKIEKRLIIQKFKQFLGKADKYASFVFIIALLGLYGFLIFQIGRTTQAEPDPNAVSQLTSSKRLKIDQESVNKIQQLEDQNINVQSLFESARDNPFQD